MAEHDAPEPSTDPMDVPPSSPDEAAAELATAERLRSAVADKSAWYVRYQLVFGLAAAVVVLAIGLAGSRAWAAAALAAWGLIIGALSWYASRQPVSSVRQPLRHRRMIVIWTVLYATALSAGLGHHQGDAAWWIPAAVVVALPAIIGAVAEARR